MDTSSRIGLVTVLYNSEDVLEDFFSSLDIQTYKNFTLYMIDNSDNDLSMQEAKKQIEKYPNLDVVSVKNDFNNGSSGGNNQGIELSLKNDCEYVLLINNDTQFDADTIEKLVSLSKSKNAPLVTPKIHIHGTNKIWVAGGYFNTIKGTTPHIGEGEEDVGQYDDYTSLEYAPTCLMLIHKDVFKKVGNMDEKYFVYYDDADFIYRCLQNGYKILFCYTTNVGHKVSHSTGGETSLFFIYYVIRNRIYFINKSLPFISKIIAHIYTAFTTSIKYLKYNKEQRIELIKGYKDGFKIKA